MGASADAGKVSAFLEPLLAATGVDLEQVEITPAGRRSVLRIIVDQDGGIDLDAVAAVSRTVSAALDEAGTMGETPYVLEVTSPGVDRPLTRPAHWRRASGRLVRVVLADGSTVTGRVHGADDVGAELREERGAPRRVEFAQVKRAQVQIEFASTDTDDE